MIEHTDGQSGQLADVLDRSLFVALLIEQLHRCRDEFVLGCGSLLLAIGL